MSRRGMPLALFVLPILFGVLISGCAERREQSMNESTTTSVSQRSGSQASAELAASEKLEGDYQQAMFGAGCFWGVEATFLQVPGVIDVASGYCGGHVDKPTYKQVCTGATGHAEVVHVNYDPTKVTYDQLLNVFFQLHDPTQLNRQGPDVGSQYRSVIFTYGDEQAKLAEASKEKWQKSGRFDRPIVTQIEPAATFYLAEAYHQRYYEKHNYACPAHKSIDNIDLDGP